MATAEQSLRDMLASPPPSRRRAAVMIAAHVLLIWALAACAMTQHTALAATLAAVLTALMALASWRAIHFIEQAESAQRVKTEKKFLSALVETSPALAAVIDDAGRVLRSNQRFRDLLEGSAPPGDALRNPSLKGADELLAFAASSEVGPMEVDLELERPHDQTLLLHFAASRQDLPASGECVVLVGQDETLRYRAQQSLAQAAKLATLGELTSGIAHELSQPLNVIRMAAQNVLVEAVPAEAGGDEEDGDLALAPMPDPEFRSFAAAKLQRIIGQVDRAASIIARMRVFSRASQAGIKEFDVREACEAALALMSASFRRAGIVVSADFGQAKVVALGQESLLQQVIVNLLVNARDALAEDADADKRIELTLRREGADRVLVEIRDNGPGVRTELRNRIFEPFFTTKPLGSGPGLGLSLAYGIMRDIGGDLRLMPGGPGASFQIELKAADAAYGDRIDRP